MSTAPGFRRFLVLDVMYSFRSTPQVCPIGGFTDTILLTAHVTSTPATPVDIIAFTKYATGDMRHMKIQKPGRALGLTRTL